MNEGKTFLDSHSLLVTFSVSPSRSPYLSLPLHFLGKSPTFLYFASKIMDKYEDTKTPIDYAMKLDADSILHLHDFLLFAHGHLPPAPYNRKTFAGALRDKAYWPKHPGEDLPRFESFFGNEYEGVHLYM